MSFADAATGDYGYPGPSYTGAGTAPTADKLQSKLWFNDGLWWSDMFDTVSQTWHIFRLNRATQVWTDTGTRIDNRPSTRGDTLWDGTHLYVASNVLASSSTANVSGQPARLYRYSYNASTKAYSLDSGFPVNINNYSSESITLDRDTRGVLWATWTQAQKVYINSTNGSDSSWCTPFALSATGASGMASDDITSLAAYGRSKIGLMWSNQNTSTFYFAIHRDGDVATTWTTKAAISDPGVADDHINLKQLEGDDEGHIYAAVKTSKDSTGSSTAAQNLLLGLNVRTGAWETATFGTVADCHTRPMIVIDKANRVLHMFATAPSSGTCPGSGSPGTIYEKTTSLDTLSFPTGRGTPVIRDAASANMNNVTGTKQNVTAASGMVILASNDATQRYWHADVQLGGTTAPSVNFTASPTSGTAPLPVSFTDTSTGGVTGWSWNFGDGGSATTRNPSHTYTSPGTYTVTLTGTTATGTSATATKTITVNAPQSSTAVTYGGSTSTGQSTTGTSVQLSVPTGATTGDLLIASFTTYAAPNVTAPSGWTSFVTLRPSGASVFGYYHVVTAADAGRTTWSFTLSTAVKWSGGMARYLNVNTSTPLDSVVRSVTSSGAASSLSVPAVTTATSGALLVGGTGADSGKVTASPPTGFTESWENALGQLAESAYAPTTAVGSQGAKTWTISGSVPMAAWSVALRPAG